jgi:hypothetical protein
MLRELLEDLLKDVPIPVETASLVLPDSWMRLMFLESEQLTGGAKNREKVLRWKLGKVVPFRTEELRLDAREVSPVPGQLLPKRVLVGFGSEALLSQVEKIFADQGIQLGNISNSSLSLLAALDGPLGGLELGLLLNVLDGSYSLLCCRNGEPIIHRVKSLGNVPDREAGAMIIQDLKMSRNFLQQQLLDGVVGRIVLLAPQELEETWRERIEQVFAMSPLSIGLEHLPMTGDLSVLSVRSAATLFGAAAGDIV